MRPLNASSASPRLPRVVYMTDEARRPDPLPAIARLPRGAGVVLRHYGDPRREELAGSIAVLCRKRGLILLIGNDPRLARKVGANGVHYAEGRAGRLCGRRQRPKPDWLVSAAVHSARALAQAHRMGCDLVFVSPVFATPSHPRARTLGVLGLAGLCRQATCPVLALGGVKPQHWRAVAHAGAFGIAGISLFDGGAFRSRLIVRRPHA